MKFEQIVNKIISFLLCLVILGSVVTAYGVNVTDSAISDTEQIFDIPTTEAPPSDEALPPVIAKPELPGDMDGDGKLMLADAREILRLCAGVGDITAEKLVLADVDENGVLTISDVQSVLSSAEDIDISWTLRPAKQLNPRKNNGINEKVKFIEVKDICAETFPESPVNDRSNPLYSSQPKGTLDYIKSGPISADGKDFYILGSGRRIYADEVKAFNGYKLPYNKAHLRLPTITSEGSTKFYIDLDWRVPFNVQIAPQNYETGYDNRAHNIKDGEFTPKYIDITFYYTDFAEGTLSFPDSAVIKSCRWAVNTEKKTAKLRIYLKNQGEFYGYTAYYNEDNLLVISVKEPSNTLEGKIIELDPGHGGEQPGAVSATGVYEANITYKIALELKKQLQEKGATVILSRGNGKKEPEIEERRLSTIEKNPDLFVSIHLDSSSSSSVSGSSVYYYKNYSAPLAQAISESLPKSLKSGMGYNLKNRGEHFYPFHVTRVENCPAVLVECGFISNSQEFKMQNSARGQICIAQGICNGIVNYLGV